MKTSEFDHIVNMRLAIIKESLITKRKEYASDEDVFSNFHKAVGISFTDSQEKVAWEYMTKHLQSLKDMIHMTSIDKYQGYPTREMIYEKIGDSINYLILIEGMLLERVMEYERETVRKIIY